MDNLQASEDKLEKILSGLAELRNDVKHLTQRMDTRAREIEALETRVRNLETRLTENDQQTKKMSAWLDWAFKGVLTAIAGFIAVKIGLKN